MITGVEWYEYLSAPFKHEAPSPINQDKTDHHMVPFGQGFTTRCGWPADGSDSRWWISRSRPRCKNCQKSKDG